MTNMKLKVPLLMAVCILVLGLSGATVAQDREAQLAEAKRINEQTLELYDANRYAEAIPLAERALAIRERVLGPRHADIATSLNNLAMLYYIQGDYGRAAPLLLRALAIREKVLGPEDPDLATSLLNLATLYSAQGEDGRATPLLLRALAIREKILGPEHPYVAQSLSGLAALSYNQGNYRLAIQLLQRALNIYEKTKDPNIATSLNGLVVLYYKQGDYGLAKQLAERALAIVENAVGPNDPNLAGPITNLAFLYRDQGDYERAMRLAARALAIYEKALGINHPSIVFLLANLATLYYAQGEYGQAISLLQRGSEVSERSIAQFLNTGSQQQKQIFLNKFFGESDAIVSLHTQSAPQNADAARLALTMILRRKGRTLDISAGQIAALRRRAVPADQKLLGQLAAIQSRIATLQLSGAEYLSSEDRQAEVERSVAEQERLEDAISRRSAEFRVQSQPITPEAVRQALPLNAALAEIFVYKPFNPKAKNDAEKFGAARYVAYVVRRDESVPQWVELGDAATIDAEVERLRAALKDPKRADVQSISRSVDERVMRPVRKLLGATRQVFLSPDGVLNLIPFAALVDENGKYLVENYSLTYLTSGRDLLRLQVPIESRSAPLVLADPLYDTAAPRLAIRRATQPVAQNKDNQRSMDFTQRDYKPLHGTAEEAVAFAQLMPDAQVLTQGKATESVLKQANRPRILHIATHGFFLADQPQDLPVGNKPLRETFDALGSSPLSARWENPLLRSGLILAGVKQGRSGAGEDGVLTALETAGLDLWGTKLVVLSACETGLGDVRNGAGIYGLRRALVLAGSQTQVMSLWKVSDAGTRDLMTAYYTRLQAGEGRTEALRQVQLTMLRGQLSAAASGGKRDTSDTGEKAATNDYRHPYYWAAFILSGDWRSMSGKEARPQ